MAVIGTPDRMRQTARRCRRTLLLLMLAAPAACTGLPDYGRGVHHARSGDREAALRDLEPLAAQGYAPAQQELAKLYAGSPDAGKRLEAVRLYQAALRQRPAAGVDLARLLIRQGDDASLHQAEALLLAADAAGDGRALSHLVELYSLKSIALPAQRFDALTQKVRQQGGIDGEINSIMLMRLGVHMNQGRGEKELIERCRALVERVPACLVELARYYRLAAAAQALELLVQRAEKRAKAGQLSGGVLQSAALMLYEDQVPATPRPEAAYRLLQAIPEPPIEARVERAALLVDYPQLDHTAHGETLLRQAAAQGSGRAALKLGRYYSTGTALRRDPVAAERYLLQSCAEFPAAHHLLGRLYGRGDLGDYEPEKALKHYLLAARAGYVEADAAIARLFTTGLGIRVNPVYAGTFGTLAEANKVAGASELLQALRPRLSATQQAEIQGLVQRERQQRGAAAPLAAVPDTRRASVDPSHSTLPGKQP